MRSLSWGYERVISQRKLGTLSTRKRFMCNYCLVANCYVLLLTKCFKICIKGCYERLSIPELLSFISWYPVCCILRCSCYVFHVCKQFLPQSFFRSVLYLIWMITTRPFTTASPVSSLYHLLRWLKFLVKFFSRISSWDLLLNFCVVEYLSYLHFRISVSWLYIISLGHTFFPLRI